MLTAGVFSATLSIACVDFIVQNRVTSDHPKVNLSITFLKRDRETKLQKERKLSCEGLTKDTVGCCWRQEINLYVSLVSLIDFSCCCYGKTYFRLLRLFPDITQQSQPRPGQLSFCSDSDVKSGYALGIA